MGLYTNFKNFQISGVEVTSKEQLNNIIQAKQDNIKSIQTEIGMLAAATPKDITPTHGGWDPLEYVRKRLNDLFDLLGDEYDDLVKCYMIEYNFDDILI